MAHTKLEMRDASLPTRASLNARLWGRTSTTHFSGAIVMNKIPGQIPSKRVLDVPKVKRMVGAC